MGKGYLNISTALVKSFANFELSGLQRWENQLATVWKSDE